MLARLGETEWATDELFEAVLAYRQARNLPLPTAGLEAVYRGGPPHRAAIDATTRRARTALSDAARGRLADIAALLGDPGVAVAFGGRDRAADRPRAYEDAVVAAAAQQGLDKGSMVENFTRVQTFGSGFNHWVELIIDPRAENLWTFKVHIVKENLDVHTP